MTEPATKTSLSVRELYNQTTLHKVFAALPFPVIVATLWGIVIIVSFQVAGILTNVAGAMSSTLIPVGIAFMLALPMLGITNWIVRVFHLPRFLAAVIMVLLFLGAIVAAIIVAGAEVVSTIGSVGDVAAKGSDQITKAFKDVPGIGDITQYLPALIESARDYLTRNWQQLSSNALYVGASITNLAAGMVVAIVSLVFFLADGDVIWRWCVRLLPRAAEEPTYQAFRRGARSVQKYSETMILVTLFDSTVLFVTTIALGLPLALPMAVLMFIAGFIPMVGITLTMIVATLVALGAGGVTSAVIMFLVMFIASQIEGNVLQPLLMGNAVSLHPFAIIIGIAIATYSQGLVGSFFVVPLMALVNSVGNYYVGRDPFPDMEDPTKVMHEPELAEATA